MGVAAITLADMVSTGARSFGSRTWLITESGRLSFQDCFERMERAAARLAAAGVVRGDRVAVLAQNRAEHLDLLFGCARVGAILVEINWRLSVDEISFILSDSAPKLILVEPMFAEALLAIRDVTEATWWSLDYPVLNCASWTTIPEGELPGCHADSEDGVLLIYTAAVSGRPRGALLSHRNLSAANVQLISALSLSADDVSLLILPLFHMSGIGQALAVQAAGGSTVLARRFDPDIACLALAHERVTLFFEFAPMLGQILERCDASVRDRSSLRAVWGLDSTATIARFETAFPDARFYVGYGQSETTGLVSFGLAGDEQASAGRPLPLSFIVVVDEEDRPVPLGKPGEIAVRGPIVFSGYWNLPDATADTFRNGLHHTGDIGCFDDSGTLIYVGRSPAKELIKSGGENVYPAEVEAVLRAHPGLAEVAVLGVPDPHWHEAVKAVCVRHHGHDVKEEDVIAFVAARLARYKRPKKVVFVPKLPRTETGAIDRAALTEQHAERNGCG